MAINASTPVPLTNFEAPAHDQDSGQAVALGWIGPLHTCPVDRPGTGHLARGVKKLGTTVLLAWAPLYCHFPSLPIIQDL